MDFAAILGLVPHTWIRRGHLSKSVVGAMSLREFLRAVCLSENDVFAVPPQHLQALRICKTRADGSCLWYALAAASVFRSGMGAEAVYAANLNGSLLRLAQQLRRDVCDELWDTEKQSFKEAYEPFWAPGEEGTGSVDTPLKYITAQRRGEIFGGYLELVAAALLIQQSIAVINVPCGTSRTVLHVIRPPANGQPPSDNPLLLFRRGLHYDAICTDPSNI